ncbi:MAG: molecular chaperone [Rhodoferax sp.]|nr:molecular chaperone [Rhodoferax sp.]
MKNLLPKLALNIGLLLLAQVAQADLMLYPTRVVIEGKARAAQVELINSGTKPETYRINLVNRRMSETGEIVEAKEAQAGEQFADELVRYSPRQVTLQPGVGQTVRLQVRLPADLANGEYRSHLQFDRVADAEGQSNLETLAKPESGQIAIVLQALVGASIPVIVRHGETNVVAMLDKLTLEAGKDNAKILNFDIKRNGNRSVYGDFLLSYTPAGGKTVDVGKVNGVAVYVPSLLRKAKLPLTLPEGVTLKGGTLNLKFSERPDAGGKLIAQAELAVP